jgi:hypothetical protein
MRRQAKRHKEIMDENAGGKSDRKKVFENEKSVSLCLDEKDTQSKEC